MRHDMQIDRAALAAEMAEERREQELRSQLALDEEHCRDREQAEINERADED